MSFTVNGTSVWQDKDVADNLRVHYHVGKRKFAHDTSFQDIIDFLWFFASKDDEPVTINAGEFTAVLDQSEFPTNEEYRAAFVSCIRTALLSSGT